MLKLLPNTNSSRKGFTLIELLIVIAIIAVLAVMGFAAFRGFTGRGNDARRSADLKALGDALEAARSQPNVTNYPALATNMFANGIVPVEPDTARNVRYCITYTTSTPAAAFPANNPVNTASFTGDWINAACPATAATSFGAVAPNSPWATIAAGSPAAISGNNATAWRICAMLANNQTIICRNSAQ